MSNFPTEPTDKLYLGFTVLFGMLMVFQAGFQAHDHDYFGVAMGIIIALFFLALTVMTVWARMQSLRDKATSAERDAEYLRTRISDQNRLDAMKAADAAKMAATEAVRNTVSHQGPELGFMVDADLRQDMQVFQAIMRDMGFSEHAPTTPEEFARLAQAFHENTDHYVTLEPADDGGIVCNFSKEAPDAESAKELAAKATKTRKNGTSMDSVKKATPAQQRKANAAKGLGSFTDAEVKEQRNAKRREARAAKKAAAEGTPVTTTTTTQPGQTALV